MAPDLPMLSLPKVPGRGDRSLYRPVPDEPPPANSLFYETWNPRGSELIATDGRRCGSIAKERFARIEPDSRLEWKQTDDATWGI
jgi:hypothetical protein